MVIFSGSQGKSEVIRTNGNASKNSFLCDFFRLDDRAFPRSAFHDVQFADLVVADAGLDGEGVGFQVDLVALGQILRFQFGHDFVSQLFHFRRLRFDGFGAGQQLRLFLR